MDMKKLDWFQAGVFKPEYTPDKKSNDVMVEAAKLFLLGGGSCTWEQWMQLSQESRWAFVQAGHTLRSEQVLMTVNTLLDTIDGNSPDIIDEPENNPSEPAVAK